jgi:hypothetical protein
MGSPATDDLDTPFHLRSGVNTETPFITLLRTLVTLSSCLLVWLIYRRYQLDVKILKAKEILSYDGTCFLLKIVCRKYDDCPDEVEILC